MEKQLSRSVEDNENEFTLNPVDNLQKEGINVVDIKKLKDNGIFTVTGVQQMTTRGMCQIKGLSDAKVEKIKEVASKLAKPKFMTGLQLAQERDKCFYIRTGSEALNEILGGGMQSQSIIEIIGEYRTGKTQLCHTLCVTTQIPINEYEGGKVIYIDTENTFRPKRIEQIAKYYGMNSDAVLANIFYCRVFNTDEQISSLDEIRRLCFDEQTIIKIIIIDSIMALFRVDYSGRGELSERQQKLNRYLSSLRKVSEEYNVVIILTNQVQADPGAMMSFQADPKKPIGGHILAHASTTRVMLKKGRADARIAKVIDSPDMAESEATFIIGDCGVTDGN
ncbi:hypothetical protein SNEBB_007199 [Seison nebaliae]|nr:hypothetical protein SNEBB_007199 [Seison nebaliae]